MIREITDRRWEHTFYATLLYIQNIYHQRKSGVAGFIIKSRMEISLESPKDQLANFIGLTSLKY